ncbi:MAG TPA: hypothetical protein VGF61_12280 [Candidatus Acidoferrum sp.]
MSKRHCTSHAKWRLKTGKPAEALSPHYRLDCDYGTAVIVCWEEGGSEPIYVCESHAKQLGRSRDHCPDARIITPPSDHTDNPIKYEYRTQTQAVVGTKPNGSPSPEVAPSLADTKLARAITAPSTRPFGRDLTFGNSAKAMVDEVIWNMATGDLQAYRTALLQGKSATEAAQAAGGQLAVVHRKITDYTLKLEALLSESKATITVAEVIDKPLERLMIALISNDAISDSEKDSAIAQLGAIQEWVKHGLQKALTPLQANRITLAIGDRLNWGGPTGVSEQFKPVYRALYASLKTAIHTIVPEAQNLHDRLTNLHAAKSDLEIR